MSPLLFRDEPELAWGRAAEQVVLFRGARPHQGYEILRRWSQRMTGGSFVITSNVDGLFHVAGFREDEILEGHGSLHFLQCTRPCTPRVWCFDEGALPAVSKSGYAAPPLPRCLDCGDHARPNVFMFGDQRFNGDRVEVQGGCLEACWRRREREATVSSSSSAAPERRCPPFARSARPTQRRPARRSFASTWRSPTLPTA